MNTIHKLGPLVLHLPALLLHSCAAPLIAVVAAPLVGGLMPSNNDVVIDEATITPELKDSFANARNLIFLSADTSDTYMAEYLELYGEYLVVLEASPQAASPSQRKTLMEGLCSNEQDTDTKTLVLSSSSGEADVGVGTTLVGVVTGRARFDITGTVDVYGCEDMSWSEFGLTITVRQGVYNADQTVVDRYVGVGFAQALMRIAGKPIPEES